MQQLLSFKRATLFICIKAGGGKRDQGRKPGGEVTSLASEPCSAQVLK